MTTEPATSPVTQQHPLPTALAVLCASAPDDSSAPQHWPRWAILLPHVQATVSLLDGTTDTDIAADMSWLLDRAGTYLQIRGRPRQARPLLEYALTLGEFAHGLDHREVGIRLKNLAWNLLYLGDLAAARPLAERALAITETAYGPDHAETAYGPEHPDVGVALDDLAVILRDLGDPDAAQPLAERALTIIECAYGPEHPRVASLRNEVAAIIQDVETGDD